MGGEGGVGEKMIMLSLQKYSLVENQKPNARGVGELVPIYQRSAVLALDVGRAAPTAAIEYPRNRTKNKKFIRISFIM